MTRLWLRFLIFLYFMDGAAVITRWMTTWGPCVPFKVGMNGPCDSRVMFEWLAQLAESVILKSVD